MSPPDLRDQVITSAESDEQLMPFAQAITCSDLGELCNALTNSDQPVGISSVMLEKELNERDLMQTVPLPTRAKELHIIAGGLNEQLPAYIYEVAKESSKAGGKCKLERIALYNFSIDDLKKLLDFMSHKFEVNYYHPIFDFMTSVTKSDSAEKYRLDKLFDELKEWDARPNHPSIPYLKVCFTADEILGTPFTTILTSRTSVPQFFNLYVRNANTATCLEPQIGQRITVMK